MKLTAKLNGSCMVRYSPEEIMPLEGGLQIPSIIELLSTTFKLTHSQSDMLGVGTLGGALSGTLIPHLIFTNGQYTHNSKTISIRQIWIANNGLAVHAQDTEEANVVSDHLFDLLNADLHFRFENLRRKYFSAVVVQYERSFESCIKQISAIADLINKALGRKETALKRFSFGQETPSTVLQVSIENIDTIDFAIERRQGLSFSENHYFSSAGLRFSDHLATLEQIEKIILS